jgi:signal transduction histidine kinase
MMEQRTNQREEGLRHEAKKYITQALNEIRNLSHLLAPAFIENESLVNAVNDLLDEMNADKKFKIVFSFGKEFPELEIPNDVKLNLYRFLQEQLKNIRKYSSATTIRVTLKLKDNYIRMLICDNGVGFNTETVKNGIGLINMRKRAESFSGRFMIESAPQKGCSVSVEIPFSNVKVA